MTLQGAGHGVEVGGAFGFGGGEVAALAVFVPRVEEDQLFGGGVSGVGLDPRDGFADELFDEHG